MTKQPPDPPREQSELREAIWRKLEWYFGGERQNMRIASKEITQIAEEYAAKATQEATVEARKDELKLANSVLFEEMPTGDVSTWDTIKAIQSVQKKYKERLAKLDTQSQEQV